MYETLEKFKIPKVLGLTAVRTFSWILEMRKRKEKQKKKCKRKTKGGFGNKPSVNEFVGEIKLISKREQTHFWRKKKRGGCSIKATHLVQLYGLDPLQSVFRIFSSEVPNAVVDADVETTLVKLMRLQKREEGVHAEEPTPVRKHSHNLTVASSQNNLSVTLCLDWIAMLKSWCTDK